MSDRPPNAQNSLLRRLHRVRILVIHPDDEDRKMLVDQLRCIGCQTESQWPSPPQLSDPYDVAIVLLSGSGQAEPATWMTEGGDAARVAIIAYETPDILEEIERQHVHGVLSKPLRIFGVLAAITTALGMAGHESRLKQRIKSLDETLRARPRIEQAVAILSCERNISEQESYARIQEKPLKSKTSVTEIADAIIAPSDI